jgi:hypothetical protein
MLFKRGGKDNSCTVDNLLFTAQNTSTEMVPGRTNVGIVGSAVGKMANPTSDPAPGAFAWLKDSPDFYHWKVCNDVNNGAQASGYTCQKVNDKAKPYNWVKD